ncbi:MAG: DUF169 domain-containing protein [Acidobacteria bacterium]|nr:DUF169 domain-containing protein [Acidobacteriota bacterium]
MKELLQDLSIYEKFNFEQAPVAVKFLLTKPDEGIKKLDKSMSLCEMITEARVRNEPFYITKDNESCVGKVALGMVDLEVPVEGGLVGPQFGIYQEARANHALYKHVHMFQRGLVNFVLFSTLGKLTFEPDLLILNTNVEQAEIIIRAMSYSTGDPIESKFTPALGCSWIFIYPFQTGKTNYMITGTTFGAKAKEAFTPGQFLFTIPYQQLPVLTQNLKNMEWYLPSYSDGREKFLKRDEKAFKEAEKAYNDALKLI